MTDEIRESQYVSNPMGNESSESRSVSWEEASSEQNSSRPVEAADTNGNNSAAISDGAMEELERQGIRSTPASWAKRATVVKNPDHYRRPTIALNRMQEQVTRREEESQEANQQPTIAQRVDIAVQRRIARGLANARTRGLVSDGTVLDVASMTMDNGSNPFAVCNQDIDIKLGFRRKLLGLLLLNLLTVLGLMFVITCTPAIFNSVKDKSWVAGVAFFVCVYSLIMMYIVKEKYPWNYISLFIFTISLAATLGCGQRAFLSYSNFQFVCNACVTVLLLLIITTVKWPCGPKKSHGVPPQRIASMIAWFIALIAGIIVQAVWLSPSGKGTVGHFVSLQVFSAFTTWYFAYDTWQIEQRLTVDDYMVGVVNYYTDFLVVVICCCCAAALMGGD